MKSEFFSLFFSLFRARPWKSQRQFSLSACPGFPDFDNHDSTAVHISIIDRQTIHHFIRTWRYFQTEVSILLTCLLRSKDIFGAIRLRLGDSIRLMKEKHSSNFCGGLKNTIINNLALLFDHDLEFCWISLAGSRAVFKCVDWDVRGDNEQLWLKFKVKSRDLRRIE